jgi:AraC-like DNA-binding protein
LHLALAGHSRYSSRVTGMGIIALDLGIRGAAAGLFLMLLVVILVRSRPFNAIRLLGATMAAASVFYAIATAPYVPKTTLWWTLPILAGIPVLLWLWARAAFDDDFVLRYWHGALWLIVIGIAFLGSLGWTAWPTLARAGTRLVSFVTLVLALAAIAQTVRTWSADLVVGRRRLRVVILAVSLLFTAWAGSDLMSFSSGVPRIVEAGVSGSLSNAFGLLVLAALAGWSTFYPPVNPAMVTTASDTSDGAASGASIGARALDGQDTIAPALLRRLDRLMSVERIYRQEGLTIAMLAVKLDVPQHRLRQAINEGLGHRNFNAFLNRYRIDEAKASLSDVSQRDVPVLTIAMDAGFQSIGPFNRAFKADTGLTPTEFRRDALAASHARASKNDDDAQIGERNREIG